MAKGRNIRYGNDPYRAIQPPSGGEPLRVTHWDLWIVLLVVRKFDGDWDEMHNYLHAEKTDSRSFFRRDKAEELIHHLDRLRQSLDRAGLSAEDVLAEADPDFLKKQYRKAKRKVLDMGYRDNERSPWMIHTPRRQREARAMRGYWSHFPVSPMKYADALERQYKTSGWYNLDQSFRLERKLAAFLEKHEAEASLAERLALYRAFLTVVVEKMGMVDDSCGVVGDLYQQVFEAYVQFDWTELDMELETFFQDLIELMIWEDYAGTDTGKPLFLSRLTPQEVKLVETILKEQWRELEELELDYQAEEALTMLGMLYREQLMFDQFVPMAQAMGTREWERITKMSETSEEHGKPDLALAVYEACLSPGMHEEFLREKYGELKIRLGAG